MAIADYLKANVRSIGFAVAGMAVNGSHCACGNDGQTDLQSALQVTVVGTACYKSVGITVHTAEIIPVFGAMSQR